MLGCLGLEIALTQMSEFLLNSLTKTKLSFPPGLEAQRVVDQKLTERVLSCTQRLGRGPPPTHPPGFLSQDSKLWGHRPVPSLHQQVSTSVLLQRGHGLPRLEAWAPASLLQSVGNY